MDSHLKNFRHDLRMYAESLRLQVRAAAALRGAFITQIIGMVINNSAIILAWLFFFNHFGTVNGWAAADYVGMLGINMFIFGVVMLLSVGLMDLPQHVDRGSFDGFLTKPTSVLGQVASSNIDVTTIGDVIIGFVLMVWYVVYAQPDVLTSVLFVGSLTIGSIIFWCFALLLPNLIAFYVFDGERLSRYMGTFFIDAGIYPTTILSGALKTVFLTAFPALLVASVQLDTLRGLRGEWLLWATGVAILWLIFSLWFFRRSLRKYESANLIGAR